MDSCPPPMAETAARRHPFDLAMGPYVPERFEAIRLDLAAAGIDPFDRDAWTLTRPVAELLQELRPDEGLGEAVTELVALVHAGFLYWQQGERSLALSREDLPRLGAARPAPASAPRPITAYYLQAPPHRIWGAAVPEAPPEPLDGWFAATRGDALAMVAVFGLLPGRPGFTVAHVQGPVPGPLVREDGTAIFSATMPGGQEAGLWSVVGQEELLELGWRAHWLVAGKAPSAASEEPAR